MQCSGAGFPARQAESVDSQAGVRREVNRRSETPKERGVTGPGGNDQPAPSRGQRPVTDPAVEEKLAALPMRPGVYLFRDAEQQVLYIGKAKNLRARVRSYFQPGNSDDRAFLPSLIRQVTDLETFVTQTEKEAAILENSLIKELRPKFNVKLRDDKEFLTLRLDPNSEWPRVDLVRRPTKDGARYFGPYNSATAARRTLHLVGKHFQLRTCSDRELHSRTRPCLQYQIKRCPAPCVYDVDAQAYADQVQAVSLFLEGRHDELTRRLAEQMQQASDSLQFEQAATYSDQMRAVQNLREAQRVVAVSDVDQDVLGLYRQGDLVELAVLSVRAGRVVEASSFSSPRVEVTDDEVVAAFLREQYGDESARAVPDEVLVPTLPEGADGIGEWLSENRQERARQLGVRAAKRVVLVRPERGPRRQLLEMAQDNARHAFEEKRRASEDLEERLTRLQAKLRLPTLPRRIECCDISHLGGQDTFGSVVALYNGAPDKQRYRTYKVTSVDGGDDYGAMAEVLERRFRRGKEAKGEGSWALPDLFVVDGGRGQLAVAEAAARDLGLSELRLAGLAKERETALGDRLVDRIYLPGQKNPIALKPNSPELFLLAWARDEAHRFANRSRERSGQRRRLTSELDAVPGIGPKTRQALLSHFGSLANVREASDAQLLAVPGIHRGHVRALREHWARAADVVADHKTTELS